MSTMMKY